MYGTSGIDPNVQTENIGDNPIKASNYGLNNLKIVASKLDEWTTKEGNSYNDLNELYNEMLSVINDIFFMLLKLLGELMKLFFLRVKTEYLYKCRLQ